VTFTFREDIVQVRYSLVVGCAVALLSGCRTTTSETTGARPEAPPPAPAFPAPQPALEPIDVTLRVEASTSKGRRFIESDEALHSGDRVALHVSLNEPAYVYVGHAAASGRRTVIFPPAGSQLLAAGVHRIPEPGQWFKLDRDVGEEDLFVYASRAPLTSEQMDAFLKDDTVKWRRVRPAPGPEPKTTNTKRRSTHRRRLAAAGEEPGALSPATRGLSLVAEEGSEVEIDKDLTKVHFLIRHRK
jgi:hypothetical protein